MTSPTRSAPGTEHLASRLTSAVDAADYPTLGQLLGAIPTSKGVCFAAWLPPPDGVTFSEVWLELFIAPDPLDPAAQAASVAFERSRIAMECYDAFASVCVEDVPVGNRSEVGAFYRVVAVDSDGREHKYHDALAASLPYGAFAPAEVIDLTELLSGDTHEEHFRRIAPSGETVPRLKGPLNILQVHVATATPEGTLAALTRRINAVAEQVRSGADLSPADEIWLAYDAIELMPVEPTIEYEAGPPFWQETDQSAEVRLQRPDIRNWGYDVIISGSAAVNPAILETGRPHELSDLAAALHAFPGGPIRLILDLVYGHADNQAIGQVPSAWFTGPDMYGQHLDYQNPIVRLHLLEMQRRKAAAGADGLRIDGAQDFTWWNAAEQRLEYDDRYMVR